jgi:hypothetical protein
MGMALPILLLALQGAGPDPDAYDPILDGDGASAYDPGERLPTPDPRAPGFRIGGSVGVYAGAVRSYLTHDDSRLRPGLRPGVAIGFGYRARAPIELGLDVMLGLGRTFASGDDTETSAYDVLIEPRLVWHFVDPRPWGLYAGPVGSLYLYDVESGGVSQAGFGPGAVVGGVRRLGPHGSVYVEVGGSAVDDYLAFERVEPSAEELAADPTATADRKSGKWYFVGRLMMGYRLTAF